MVIIYITKKFCSICRWLSMLFLAKNRLQGSKLSYEVNSSHFKPYFVNLFQTQYMPEFYVLKTFYNILKFQKSFLGVLKKVALHVKALFKSTSATIYWSIYSLPFPVPKFNNSICEHYGQIGHKTGPFLMEFSLSKSDRNHVS